MKTVKQEVGGGRGLFGGGIVVVEDGAALRWSPLVTSGLSVDAGTDQWR